jgi:hypothetical protein
VQTILANTQFPSLPSTACYKFTNGGDGASPTDHELFFLSGDLNYRIDYPRPKVIASISNKHFEQLHQFDQLCTLRRTFPLHPLANLSEGPLDFAPTYKYNRNTQVYDTSEKKRTPAWCDRILYRTSDSEKIGLLTYKRFECDVSDHRPICAGFSVQSKKLNLEKRHSMYADLERYFWTGEKQRRWTAQIRWLSSFGFPTELCEKVYSSMNYDSPKSLEYLESNVASSTT